ncbi:hypothetical protein C8R44DRAFT_753583 [Mycena epipterygia]|nr:hypothetical protein C8R44DRAFT_753583 [Mycena epipterygia]
MTRDELMRIDRDQEVRIGVTLFGDGVNALILSLDPGGRESKGIYELMHLTTHQASTHTLHVRSRPPGFKPTLSARIPSLAAPRTPHLYNTLLNTLPNKAAFPSLPSDTRDFDWAGHPGGGAILSAIQDAMRLDKEHMRASWDVAGTREGMILELNYEEVRVARKKRTKHVTMFNLESVISRRGE